MADATGTALTVIGTTVAVADTLCNPPSLTFPQPPTDILALIVQLLESLGIGIPHLPSIPHPPAFCALD